MDKKIFETIRQQASDIQTAQAALTRTIKKQIIAEVEAMLDPELFKGDKDVQEFYKDEANTEAWKITDRTETIDYIFEDFDTRMAKAIHRAADKVAIHTVEAWG